jgi:hypothetical protein
MRLHRDRRGLASMEFILAAPVILLIVIFVKHANLLSSRKIDTMREMRNAAFAEANGLTCVSDFSQAFPLPLPALPDFLPAGQGPERLTCSSKPSHEGGGDPKRTFVWDDIDGKAKNVTSSLAGKLREEKPKRLQVQRGAEPQAVPLGRLVHRRRFDVVFLDQQRHHAPRLRPHPAQGDPRRGLGRGRPLRRRVPGGEIK